MHDPVGALERGRRGGAVRDVRPPRLRAERGDLRQRRRVAAIPLLTRPRWREVAALGAEPRRADVTDRAATAAALEGADGVVHAAALVGDWGALEDFVAVNVRGTRNVLDAAGAARVVHVSSVATWATSSGATSTRTRPCARAGSPTSTRRPPRTCWRCAAAPPSARPGDVYGPRSVPGTLRPLQALRARTLVLPGRGEGLLTLVYVDDLVDCSGAR